MLRGHRASSTPGVHRASRIIWWAKPHSLAYQAITLTSVPSIDPGELEVDDGGT